MKKLLLAAALSFIATPVLACPKSDHAEAPATNTKTADKDKTPAPAKTTAPKKQVPAKKKTDGTKVSIK